VRWGNEDLWQLDATAPRCARASVGAVFQQPAASLNPRRRIGDSIAEPLMTHARSLTSIERHDRVAAALKQVGLPSEFAQRWPDALSGGEAQRVALARALILQPALVVLDEPTSALDASAAASILNVMGDLTRDSGTAFLVVSHDLAAVAYVARRLVVLEAGRIVADGDTDALYQSADIPVLAGLMGALGD
jgi:ABC-type microcin C transport system duplicated ATPase subunit YejF